MNHMTHNVEMFDPAYREETAEKFWRCSECKHKTYEGSTFLLTHFIDNIQGESYYICDDCITEVNFDELTEDGGKVCISKQLGEPEGYIEYEFFKIKRL